MSGRVPVALPAEWERPATPAEALAVVEEMSKALNNIGAELAGPSSNPGGAAEIAKVHAIFARWSITSERMRMAIATITEYAE